MNQDDVHELDSDETFQQEWFEHLRSLSPGMRLKLRLEMKSRNKRVLKALRKAKTLKDRMKAAQKPESETPDDEEST